MMQVNGRASVASRYSHDYSGQNIDSSKFTYQAEVETEKEEIKTKVITKEEIKKKFPNLSERDLDDIIKNYDIETMNSSELYQLADELMKKM